MENYWSRLLLEEPMENLYTIWDSVAPLPRSLWKTTACPMENSMGLTGSLCMGHLGSAGENTAHVNWNSVWWRLRQSSLFFPSLLSWLSRVYTEFSLHGFNWQPFYFSGSVCMCACVSLMAKSDHSLPKNSNPFHSSSHLPGPQTMRRTREL